MMSSSPQTPANPLLLAALAATASLLVGAFTGAFSPVVGLAIPPYFGPFLLLGIALCIPEKNIAEREAWSLAVSAAIICIPLGTTGILITQ